MTSAAQKTRTLNNGVKIPMIGTGAYAPPEGNAREKAKDWLLTALKAGYRHIDTAKGYGTEPAVGKAVRESGIPREEIFITSKLPPSDQHRVAESLEESLKDLGTYIDLYLVHWPLSSEVDADGKLKYPDDYFVETWAEMEKALEQGKVKSIGISNFSIKNLEILLKKAKVVPAANQVEMHPYLAQNDLLDYCNKKGIAIEAYTPSGYDTVRNDPVIKEIAQKHGVTPNQVTLAWHLSRNVIIVPKSANEERQKENITLPTLDEDDIKKINSLDRGQRICNNPNEEGKVFYWTREQLGW